MLILDEPVQGVDVGAKADIFARLRQSAAEGAAVMVIDSDFENLAVLCDRVLVRRSGAVVEEFIGDRITAALMSAATFGVQDDTLQNQAIAAIADDAWTPVHYPGAITEPDTGELICRRRSRRNFLHRIRQHQRTSYRPAHRPARQRPQSPPRTVPRVALPSNYPPSTPNRSPTPTSPTGNTQSSDRCSPM